MSSITSVTFSIYVRSWLNAAAIVLFYQREKPANLHVTQHLRMRTGN